MGFSGIREQFVKALPKLLLQRRKEPALTYN